MPISIYQELNALNFENLIFENQFEYAYAEYSNNNNMISVNLKLQSGNISWKINNPCLPGKHNMANLLCASIMAYYIGIPENKILAQWEEQTTRYEHLEHRLEKVSSGIKTYLDNSLNVIYFG